MLLNMDPQLAEHPAREEGIRNGQLPLHAAAHCGMVGLVAALLQIYPQAAAMADDWGRLPLHAHLESYHGMSVAIVTMLLEAHPPAPRMCFSRDKMALHFAADGRGDLKALLLLLEVYPPAAGVWTSSLGDLPLRMAARNPHMDQPTFMRLLRAFPLAVTVTNASEKLPLHDANTELTAECLVKAFPAGVMLRDRNGALPELRKFPQTLEDSVLPLMPIFALCCIGIGLKPSLVKKLRAARETVKSRMVHPGEGFRTGTPTRTTNPYFPQPLLPSCLLFSSSTYV